MESKWTYLIQAAGFVLVAIGIVLTAKQPVITTLLLFGALAWWVGGYARKRNLL
jgi:hypothetical protein